MDVSAFLELREGFENQFLNCDNIITFYSSYQDKCQQDMSLASTRWGNLLSILERQLAAE